MQRLFVVILVHDILLTIVYFLTFYYNHFI